MRVLFDDEIELFLNTVVKYNVKRTTKNVESCITKLFATFEISPSNMETITA